MGGARFDHPTGVAVLPDGALVVTDRAWASRQVVCNQFDFTRRTNFANQAPGTAGAADEPAHSPQRPNGHSLDSRQLRLKCGGTGRQYGVPYLI